MHAVEVVPVPHSPKPRIPPVISEDAASSLDPRRSVQPGSRFTWRQATPLTHPPIKSCTCCCVWGGGTCVSKLVMANSVRMMGSPNSRWYSSSLARRLATVVVYTCTAR